MSWRKSTKGKGLPPRPPSERMKSSPWTPNNEHQLASNGGHGTDDTLRVTQILEENGIPCCLAGISALIFYGAARGRTEICVPTDSVDKAKNLLQSEPHSTKYCLVERWPDRERSLVHTYNRFKSKGINHYFMLVPSFDMHIELGPPNIVRSMRGLPYPSLPVFIQSCLDRRARVELDDVVDGTDVSEQWGEQNLQLDGTNDVEWARKVNRTGTEFGGDFGPESARFLAFVPDAPKSRREMWQEAVRTKEKRLDWTKPRDIFVTKYRLVDEPDSWTVLSEIY